MSRNVSVSAVIVTSTLSVGGTRTAAGPNPEPHQVPVKMALAICLSALLSVIVNSGLFPNGVHA